MQNISFGYTDFSLVSLVKPFPDCVPALYTYIHVGVYVCMCIHTKG